MKNGCLSFTGRAYFSVTDLLSDFPYACLGAFFRSPGGAFLRNQSCSFHGFQPLFSAIRDRNQSPRPEPALQLVFSGVAGADCPPENVLHEQQTESLSFLCAGPSRPDGGNGGSGGGTGGGHQRPGFARTGATRIGGSGSGRASGHGAGGGASLHLAADVPDDASALPRAARPCRPRFPAAESRRPAVSLARALAGRGLICELGIHHRSELNQYNLADDLIEAFRPLVDYYVVRQVSPRHLGDEYDSTLTKEDRHLLLDILNQYATILDKRYSIKHLTEKVAESLVGAFLDDDPDALILPALDKG